MTNTAEKYSETVQLIGKSVGLEWDAGWWVMELMGRPIALSFPDTANLKTSMTNLYYQEICIAEDRKADRSEKENYEIVDVG